MIGDDGFLFPEEMESAGTSSFFKILSRDCNDGTANLRDVSVILMNMPDSKIET